MLKGNKSYTLGLILILILIFAFKYSSSANKDDISPNIQISTYKSRFEISVISTRSVIKDSNRNVIIVEVSILADSNCTEKQMDCTFNRQGFQLVSSDNNTYTPAAPPLFPIPNFQYRELVLERTLLHNQSERGQLYFVVPSSLFQGELKYNNKTVAPNLKFPVK